MGARASHLNTNTNKNESTKNKHKSKIQIKTFKKYYPGCYSLPLTELLCSSLRLEESRDAEDQDNHLSDGQN